MTYIDSVTTELPRYKYSTDDIIRAASSWLEAAPEERSLFERLSHSTKIENRSFAIPVEEILRLNGAGTRAKIFADVGTKLLTDVISKSLLASGLGASDVGALLFTSCTVPAIPSIDVKAIDSLGLPPGMIRLPVFQHGCAGGAVGLALASHVAPSDKATLLASVELCSLIYQAKDLSGGNIVGSAIFGDGAACVALRPDSGRLKIVSTHSHLIPNTYHLMGYDIFDDGTHLRLDRDVPQCLAEIAPGVIASFLKKSGLSSADVRWWLFHPGGAKILNTLEDSLQLSPQQCRWGWEALKSHGNMSSASVLFALAGFLDEAAYTPGDKVFMLGVGPGLMLQLNLFECVA